MVHWSKWKNKWTGTRIDRLNGTKIATLSFYDRCGVWSWWMMDLMEAGEASSGAARAVDIAAASLEARPVQVKERRVVNVRK